MDGFSVTFDRISLQPDNVDTQWSTHPDLKKNWIPFKGKLPYRIMSEHVSGFLPMVHPTWKNDHARCEAWLKLKQLAEKYAGSEEALEYFLNPSEVRAKKKLTRGELKLVPCTVLDKVMLASKTSTTIVTQKGGPAFFLEPPVKAGQPDHKDWNASTMFAAFWWGKTSDDDDEVNMVRQTVKVGELQFPILSNSIVVQPFGKLVLKSEQPAKGTKKQRTA